MNSNRKNGPGQLLIETIDDVRVRPTNSHFVFLCLSDDKRQTDVAKTRLTLPALT